jgi:hypothetical protein
MMYTCPLKFLMDTILADLRNEIQDDLAEGLLSNTLTTDFCIEAVQVSTPT